MDVKILEKLGFEKAASKVKEGQAKNRKLHIAYNNFEFVTQEAVDKFNKDLRKRTEKNYEFETLTFKNIKDYPEAPPKEVLDKLKEAMDKKCFDEYEIAKIETAKEDPILFGRVNGCGDRFFVAEWDFDVTLEMIKAVK